MPCSIVKTTARTKLHTQIKLVEGLHRYAAINHSTTRKMNNIYKQTAAVKRMNATGPVCTTQQALLQRCSAKQLAAHTGYTTVPSPTSAGKQTP